MENIMFGFFLIEVNEDFAIKEVIEIVNVKKKAFLVDFKEHGTDFYNENLDLDYYNCVVFYNINYSPDPIALLEGFNMNRDNFMRNRISYVFILPSFLVSYVRTKPPNLDNYMTGHIDLSQRYVSPFEPLLRYAESQDLDIDTRFVIDYNDLVHKISANNVKPEDYHVAEEKFHFYRSACSEKSTIYLSYCSLVSWIMGCINGNLDGALILSRQTLKLKREVFTENHYSIAVSHYCNSVLLYMHGRRKKALHCLEKAIRILRNNEGKIVI